MLLPSTAEHVSDVGCHHWFGVGRLAVTAPLVGTYSDSRGNNGQLKKNPIYHPVRGYIFEDQRTFPKSGRVYSRLAATRQGERRRRRIGWDHFSLVRTIYHGSPVDAVASIAISDKSTRALKIRGNLLRCIFLDNKKIQHK